MGPIYDDHGLEQGGVYSSDAYKVYNNQVLDILEKSEQGVKLGEDLVITGVGQADDLALVSNNIYNLLNALHLTVSYYKRFQIELSPEKNQALGY